jgi:hypothetical protein
MHHHGARNSTTRADWRRQPFRQRGAMVAGLDRLPIETVDHAAEHQPGRQLVLGSVRPSELRAADQAGVDIDRIRPDTGDRLFRRSMRRQRVGQRRHAGIECAPRIAQRLIRLKHDGEWALSGSGADPEAMVATAVAQEAAMGREFRRFMANFFRLIWGS